MRDAEVTTADMDALLAFLPLFEGAKFEPVLEWNPWPVYTAEVSDFFSLVGSSCWIDYDYLSHAASKKIDDDAFIGAASLDEIKTMLTLCMRSERFGDGSWAHFLESGRIAAILRRIAVIRSEWRAARGG